MKFQYTCPRCYNKFVSPLNANVTSVFCPRCGQRLFPANITTVFDDAPQQPRRVQPRPVNGQSAGPQHVKARPVTPQQSVTPQQPSPVTPQPVTPPPVTPPDPVEPVTPPDPVEPVTPRDPIEPVDDSFARRSKSTTPKPQTQSKPKEQQRPKATAPTAPSPSPTAQKPNPADEAKADEALLKKAIAAAADKPESPVDDDTQVDDSLKDAFVIDPTPSRHVRKGRVVLLAVILLLIVGGLVFLFLKMKTTTTAAVDPNEKLAIERAEADSLRAYARQNADLGIKEYFAIDINHDGIREVIANSDKHLIVYGSVDRQVKRLARDDVYEWVWLRGKGLFAIYGDDTTAEGRAVWLKQGADALVEDSTQENLSRSADGCQKMQNGTTTSVTEDDYYSFVNSIVTNYTKLQPIKL